MCSLTVIKVWLGSEEQPPSVFWSDTIIMSSKTVTSHCWKINLFHERHVCGLVWFRHKSDLVRDRKWLGLIKVSTFLRLEELVYSTNTAVKVGKRLRHFSVGQSLLTADGILASSLSKTIGFGIKSVMHIGLNCLLKCWKKNSKEHWILGFTFPKLCKCCILVNSAEVSLTNELQLQRCCTEGDTDLWPLGTQV